jgi:hypothetical protein
MLAGSFMTAGLSSMSIFHNLRSVVDVLLAFLSPALVCVLLLWALRADRKSASFYTLTIALGGIVYWVIVFGTIGDVSDISSQLAGLVVFAVQCVAGALLGLVFYRRISPRMRGHQFDGGKKA